MEPLEGTDSWELSRADETAVSAALLPLETGEVVVTSEGYCRLHKQTDPCNKPHCDEEKEGEGKKPYLQKPCRHYNQKQGCKFGELCKYPHKPRSEIPEDEAAENNSKEETPSSKPCRFFNQKHGCKNGSLCKYLHKKIPPCNKPRCNGRDCQFDHKMETRDNYELNKDKGICKFFNRRHGCKHGEECRYEHKTMPPCPKNTCGGWDCELDHKTTSTLGPRFLGEAT